VILGNCLNDGLSKKAMEQIIFCYMQETCENHTIVMHALA
jgi:hypothetical protein